MIYELRKYVAAPGKERELRDRFVNGTFGLFERLNIAVLDFWEHTTSSGEFWYMVEWPDEDTMRKTWDDFRKNEDWLALKASSEANGPLTASITSIPLARAGYFRGGRLEGGS